MDIICAICGAHFSSVEGVKEHAKHCKGVKDNEIHERSSRDTSSLKPNRQIEVIFPPSIPIPTHPKMNKPFLGAFKDTELKEEKDRFCIICNQQGLVAHMIVGKGYKIIDFYWCSCCKQALWEAQTYIK